MHCFSRSTYSAGANHSCQCLSVAVNSCQCLSVTVNSCQCLSVAVNSCQCLNVTVNSCQCLSVAVNSCQCLSVAVNSCQCATLELKFVVFQVPSTCLTTQSVNRLPEIPWIIFLLSNLACPELPILARKSLCSFFSSMTMTVLWRKAPR